MIRFFSDFISLIYILIVLSKYRILSDLGSIYLNFPSQIFIRVISFLFYPFSSLYSCNQSFDQRLINCLKELGPVYIKLGQILSTRPDLIGIEIASSLKLLQDNLPSFPTQEAKKIIKESLKKEIDEMFITFSNTPVAAASIAQVYKAYLTTGEVVAVKVLRPGIYSKYIKNIKLLYFFVRFLLKFLPKIKRLKLIEVVDVLKNTMTCELNMKLEAASYSEMLENFKQDYYVYIPKVYWEFTSEKVLTTEWVSGISIYEHQLIADQGISLKDISEKIVLMFFNQAYRDGFFHADLHPGNIVVLFDGRICLMDFGIMGRLSEVDRIAVAEILYGFLKKDYKNVARVHKCAGYIPKDSDLDLFSQYCRSVAEPIIGVPLKNVSLGKLLTQLFQITENFGMETQPQLLLLQKTMVLVEGISKSLNPEIDMWSLTEPWMKKWAAKNISLEAKVLRSCTNLLKQLINKL